MPKPYRYTYENPPPEVLTFFPNWVQALDEEGEDGQDETTIKPDEVQDRIAESTQHTAAEVVLPNGNRCVALLYAWRGLWDGSVMALTVYEAESEWAIAIKDWRWEPDAWSPATRRHGDTRSFPLRVASRLASAKTGNRLALVLFRDGTVQQISEEGDPAGSADTGK